MRWGYITWTFFHTLAAKIPDDRYNDLKADVLAFIKMICAVLPCPNCSQHATAYLNKIQLKHVATKAMLVNMLYGFHNEVNASKHVKPFPQADLERYASLNLPYLYAVFMQEFFKATNNPRLLMDSMARTRIKTQFAAWMQGSKLLIS
jgi:hypothetical protein